MRPGEGVPTAASIIYMRNSDRAKKKNQREAGGKAKMYNSTGAGGNGGEGEPSARNARKEAGEFTGCGTERLNSTAE